MTSPTPPDSPEPGITPLHDLEWLVLSSLPGTISGITALGTRGGEGRPPRVWTAFVHRKRRVNVTWDGKNPFVFEVRAADLHAAKGTATPERAALDVSDLLGAAQWVRTQLLDQPVAVPTRHVMFDIETLSTRKNAVIWAIGAQIFTHVQGQTTVLAEREVFIEAQSGIDAGGDVRGDTVVWWTQQSEEARAKFAYSQEPEQAQPERDALRTLAAWIDAEVGSAPRAVWGNGAASDIAQLESAYERQDLTPPWSYRDVRCYRTLNNQAPQVAATTRFEGVPHDALDDARHQTKVLTGIARFLNFTELF